MKRIVSVFLFMLLSAVCVYAQDESYKVVFDLTTKDSLAQKAVMRWVREIASSNPKAQVEIVMYAKGYELVMPEKSTVIAEVKEAMKNPNVTFAVCSMSLKNNQIERSRVLERAQTVPDGIYEIISKQRQGWGYIKVAQ